MLLAALLLPLTGCGGEPDSAAEAYEERADALEEAADLSSREDAAQLENLAGQPERKADGLEEMPADITAEAAGSNVMAPIPDNVSAGDR